MSTPSRQITPRGIEINEAAGQPFEALKVARNLLHTSPFASLSTIDAQSGYPYGTVTNLAIDADGTPYFFAAWLSLHARNMAADNRVSLTMAQPGATDVLAQPRLSLVGRVEMIHGKDWKPETERRYLARFPKSKLYLGLPDALFYRMTVEDLQLNGGPARNAVSDVTPARLRISLEGAESLMAAEADLLQAINGTEGEAARLAVLAGGKEGRWKATGLDPEGVDLAAPKSFVRLWFAKPARTPQEFHERLS
ncbi:pyridoxamine 5'-phosphate oxidase family protein [Rhizobium sp. RU36D]|uniref:HugZ family pyridoxamine 5'-phosphate oxidase n=1 Tax=Rhizobium sp. RU36D TaxID=1907415 RepID=UPI0009D821E0|nr:pyridoxamine 5'-phosphate oxidase family protein [Rhizobium sp. RU36D]SMC62388.1 hypothetical protein SAMN05880593_103308 [Rhizobium sp. RU36D]